MKYLHVKCSRDAEGCRESMYTQDHHANETVPQCEYSNISLYY